MTAQGFDKAEQRGERRSQFVAGAGDEVGAHLFDAPFAGQVADKDERARRVADRAAARVDRRDIGAAGALDAAGGGEFDRMRLIRCEHVLRRLEHIRRAQDGGEMAPLDFGQADQLQRRRIGVLDDAVRIENEQGFGQGARHPLRHAQPRHFRFLGVQLRFDDALHRRGPDAAGGKAVANGERRHERHPGEQRNAPVGDLHGDQRPADAGADAGRPHEVAGAHLRGGVADEAGEIVLHEARAYRFAAATAMPGSGA